MTDEVRRLIQKGKSLYEKQKYQRALKFCDKGLAIDPENVTLLHLKSLNLAKLKQYKESMKFVDKALEFRPFDFKCLNLKANLFLSMNKYADAIFFYDNALKIKPYNTKVIEKKEIANRKLLLENANEAELANDFLGASKCYMKLDMVDEAERCRERFTKKELAKTTANKRILSPQIITCPHCNKIIDLKKISMIFMLFKLP